jgi:predicted nucleic acid-binding Zn ribbon protein
MNTSVSRLRRVVDMLDEAYAGPCAIARDPRPSRKVVSTLQVSRFMARQVQHGIPGNAAVGSTPNGQPAEFTDLEGSGQVELAPGSGSV